MEYDEGYTLTDTFEPPLNEQEAIEAQFLLQKSAADTTLEDFLCNSEYYIRDYLFDKGTDIFETFKILLTFLKIRTNFIYLSQILNNIFKAKELMKTMERIKNGVVIP